MFQILVGFLIIVFIGVTVFHLRFHLEEHSRSTIIIIMAIIIFTVTMITILKTYLDYQLFITRDQPTAILSKVLSNISLAVFLDFSVLIIGGLFLYLSNHLYLASLREERKIKQLEDYMLQQSQRHKIAKKQLKKSRKQLIKDYQKTD